MKKLIFAIAAAIAVCGCDNENTAEESRAVWTHHGRETLTKVVQIEGHKCVLMRGFKCGGIVHAASCPCMAK